MRPNRLVLVLIVTASACGSEFDTYQARSAVGTALSSKAVTSMQIGIVEFWLMHERMPADLPELAENARSDIPEPDPDDGIADLSVEDGALVITLSGNEVPGLKGEVIATAPCVRDGDSGIHWACGLGSCETGVTAPGPAPNTLTTLEADLLPPRCR